MLKEDGIEVRAKESANTPPPQVPLRTENRMLLSAEEAGLFCSADAQQPCLPHATQLHSFLLPDVQTTVKKVTCSPHLKPFSNFTTLPGPVCKQDAVFSFLLFKGRKCGHGAWVKKAVRALLPVQSDAPQSFWTSDLLFQICCLPLSQPLLWREVIPWVFCRGMWLMQCLF